MYQVGVAHGVLGDLDEVVQGFRQDFDEEQDVLIILVAGVPGRGSRRRALGVLLARSGGRLALGG